MTNRVQVQIMIPKPAIATSPEAITAPKVVIALTKQALEQEQQVPITSPSANILLDSAEETFAPDLGITDKLVSIEQLLGEEGIPVDRIKAGLKDVMLCLKENEGTILELEQKDIKLIVQGYTAIADKEVKDIVIGKQKKGKAKAKTDKARVTKELAEATKGIDLTAVEW